MTTLAAYADPESLPATDAARIGMLLGLKETAPLDDVRLADRIARGLRAASADALGSVLGRTNIVGPLIPEATLRRAKKARKPLSREMSERLYEVGRVIDAVGRIYHGDRDAMLRFLTTPHRLLGGETPLAMARSSSAGADAVINLLRRAEAGVAV